MTQKRHLLIGAVGLVRGKVRDDGKAMVSVCDELEPFFDARDALAGAPFDVVSIVLRYGTGRTAPQIGHISRRHAEIEVAIELPMEEVRRLSYDRLRSQIREAALEGLVAVAGRYGLSDDPWRECLAGAKEGT